MTAEHATFYDNLASVQEDKITRRAYLEGVFGIPYDSRLAVLQKARTPDAIPSRTLQATAQLASDLLGLRDIYQEDPYNASYRGYRDAAHLVLLAFSLIKERSTSLDQVLDLLWTMGFDDDDYDLIMTSAPGDMLTRIRYQPNLDYSPQNAVNLRNVLGELQQTHTSRMLTDDFMVENNLDPSEMEEYSIGFNEGWNAWRFYSSEG